MIAVLDTSAVEFLNGATEDGRARLRALREACDDLVMPAAVLAEGVLAGRGGRDHHVRQLLAVVGIRPVDEVLGYAAGDLRRAAVQGGSRRNPSGVDAIVAAAANVAGDDAMIITGDRDDMKALLATAANRDRIKLVGSVLGELGEGRGVDY